MLQVILDLANVGVDCFRLDAIAFIWKRLGTNCQGQPEVHEIVQALRAALHLAAPAVVFKAEAIVAPEELSAYLGRGPHAGKVCDLAYHNSLMVQIWSSLATGEAGLMRRALSTAPPKPVTTAWGTYVRCHDDIGWAISNADAGAQGLSGFAHRAFLSRFYSGDFPGSFARGEVFQANPVTGDARISGTLASLAGLQSAFENGDPGAVDVALGRIFLVHAIIFGFGGIPLLYMGDELGLLNDHSYRSDSRLAADNRWTHRPRMPWGKAERGAICPLSKAACSTDSATWPRSARQFRRCTPLLRARPSTSGRRACSRWRAGTQLAPWLSSSTFRIAGSA
jgi:Glycosidases